MAYHVIQVTSETEKFNIIWFLKCTQTYLTSGYWMAWIGKRAQLKSDPCKVQWPFSWPSNLVSRNRQDLPELATDEQTISSNLACVASVSARVRRESWDESKKEEWKGRGKGENQLTVFIEVLQFLSVMLWNMTVKGPAAKITHIKGYLGS